MLIEEKFNNRSAKIIEVQPPSITVGPHLSLGIKMQFFRLPSDDDRSTISMHLTPDEALQMIAMLCSGIRRIRP